jgi:four helix bundle protein
MEEERRTTQRFEDLIVWQKAHALVLSVYKASASFPPHEQYCLRSQLRRAAISVPANIAEGYAKQSKADKARFYNIAQGSLEEVRYYLILSGDLGYMKDHSSLFNSLLEVSRLLSSYRAAMLDS